MKSLGNREESNNCIMIFNTKTKMELNKNTDKTSILGSTFNERENQQELIKKLDNSLIKYYYEVIIVDDYSPEGTINVEKELLKDYSIRVIDRKEKGLSTTFIRDIQKLKNENIVIIDAELQHPSEKIPKLFETLNNGVDIAIGNRFVAMIWNFVGNKWFTWR